MKEKKIIKTMHPMHCGGSCILNLHVEAGRIKQITSAGDIKREGADEADESLAPIQRRACPMGYSEINKIYAPDRLKYPLKQTKERGNLRGFQRISWTEALDTIAAWYREMEQEKEQLGYLPIWDQGGVGAYIGPCLKKMGNYSAGNIEAAVYGALGDYKNIQGNPATDIFNANYIILWSCNVAETMSSLPFYLIKAKEAGIPITVVETRGTDSAFTLATGKGAVPGLITLRPGTDGALLAAMCYIIYHKKLHDEAFIKTYCFGFYPGDSVKSKSAKLDPVTGEPYRGTTFQVPPGMSFVEYLEGLEEQHGGYDGVLGWASGLTGVDRAVIEALAIEYVSADPAFLFSRYHGGAQRMQNSMYYSWLMIALSVMSGNIRKRGGGFGDIKLSEGYRVELPGSERDAEPDPRNEIKFSVFKDSDVILNGTDGRTKEQLRADVKQLNGIDIGAEGCLQVKMFVRGRGGGNIFNQTQNINKRIKAFRTLTYTVAYERFLSPTAAMCDIVLPVITPAEESYFPSSFYSDSFVVNKAIEPLYECRPDWWINEQLAKRLEIENYPYRTLTDDEQMKKQWEQAKIPDRYKEINRDARLPSYEEIRAAADFQLNVPEDKTYVPLMDKKPGEFDTDTGRINFYSPYYASRGRTVLKEPRPMYVKNPESYEDIQDKGGIEGQHGLYSLQLFTPHVITRAHTNYDNLPVLKEQNPHTACIHPEEGKKRGLENGQMVYVYNDYGCIKIPVEYTVRVQPGTITVGQGVWYRPSLTEYYEAYFDTDLDGIPEKQLVPVDVGGCCNCLIPDQNAGVLDPMIKALGMSSGGVFCEVSAGKP